MKSSLVAGASVGLLIYVLGASGASARVLSITIGVACAILLVSGLRRSRADRQDRQG